MFEYAIHFYANYQIIFYLILFVLLIIEGPITILALSLIAPKLYISFIQIFILAFFGEIFGDLIHYVIGRFFKTNIIKNKKFKILEKIEKKLKKHSLFEQLIVIKYTPPITSIGLLYMGFLRINFLKFIKNISFFAFFNSLVITIIGYNFGYLFKNNDNLSYYIIALFISFLCFYFLIKLLAKYIIKKIYE